MMPNPMFGRALALARADDLRAQARGAGRRRGRLREPRAGARIARWRLSLGLALVDAGFRVLGPGGLDVERGTVR